jgi:septum formation protein
LTRAHLNFSIVQISVDESPIAENPDLTISQKVQALAQLKVRAGFAEFYSQTQGNGQSKTSDSSPLPSGSETEVWIGGDTLFEFQGQLWGKPQTPAQAHHRLQQMSGQWGTVYSGLCLLHRGREYCSLAQAEVKLAALTSTEISAYIATGEPLSAAGNFAIEECGGPFVEQITGDYFAIIGLSLFRLRSALTHFNLSISDFWTPPTN